MVGHHLADQLRHRDAQRAWRIVILAAEPRPAYDRVALSSYADGATAAELDLTDPDFHADDRIELRLGDPVVRLDRAARTVTTRDGHRVGYDVVVLATGSRPFVPPVAGSDGPACFTYRTIDDLDAIGAAARGGRTGVVVGGGLLGLEAANALRRLGLHPHVVELAPRLMPVQLDEGGGAVLGDLVEQLGVTVHCGVSVAGIRPGPHVVLADGTGIDADVVVFAAGVRPDDRLVANAGLALGPRGGVAVDDRCRTDDPAVFAVGECASVDGRCYGLVGPGRAMADVVVDRLLGGDARFTGADESTKLKLLGVDVASFGDAHAGTPGALSVVVNDAVSRSYAKLVVSDDAASLLGGMLVGDASAYSTLWSLVGRPLPADPLSLIAPAAATVGVGALPADAQICSCNHVTKGAIVTAVADGVTDIAELKRCTRAGTGCGSCVPMLSALLTEAGVAQPTGICEHFEQSRSELFEIVRVTGIRSYAALVQRYGRGSGCDLCKPVAASILASLGSGHILDGEQGGLQDTNDHMLANLQRNGSYSIVPRIPGGEITPDRLIVLGEVARDFGLYTKITGGQRIDLLGARVEQLPAIWRRLVDAGFESGHAYGKALRTVKSCVGTTWCRYGVQDSVGLAIALELRYRGLRSPHKIKAGVSGCARECAEARSKDIGVIATEAGWNLYVGGNGGFTPRHADLLVSDVDTDTLVRLIDRFLMFYIRTAERLQRTSSWLTAMDGGLDHLRAVIVDDSLGLCDELEAAMGQHVAGYTDEWRAVLADPARLARFTSFVNAPGTPDPTIRFESERGQRIPARGPVPLPTPAGTGPAADR
jgi:nitrite reductase (NADH) large subunit